MKKLCVVLVAILSLAMYGSTAQATNIDDISYDSYNCEMIYTTEGWKYFSIGGDAYCYVQLPLVDVNGNYLYDNNGNQLMSYQYNAYLMKALENANWDFSAVAPAFRRDYYDGVGGFQWHTVLMWDYVGSYWLRASAVDSPYIVRWQYLFNGYWDTLAGHRAAYTPRVNPSNVYVPGGPNDPIIEGMITIEQLQILYDMPTSSPIPGY